MRKALYFLGILDDLDIAWIVKNGVKQKISAGTVLIQEGKAVDALFFVLDGEVEVSIGTAHKAVAILRAGEVLGELSFVDARPPSATVTAVRESVVGTVPRAALLKKIASDMGFRARFYHSMAVFLADRLRSTTGLLVPGDQLELAEDIEDRDELSPHLLETLSLSGTKFAAMQLHQWGG